MTVYVLGAGASFHAGYPLASKLLAGLDGWIRQHVAAYASSFNIVERDHFTKLLSDLEDMSTRYGNLKDVENILNDSQPEVLERLSEGIREYFVSLSQGKSHLYQRLVAERIRPGDVVITFNYDPKIELELRQKELWDIRDGYGFSIVGQSESFELSRVRVIKLHGSINWAGALFGGSKGFGKASSAYGPRPVIPFLPDYQYLGYDSVIDDLAPREAASYGFALITPTPQKRFCLKTPFGEEWKSFWDGLFGQAEAALRNAEKVVLIGYSLPEVDERARQLVFEQTKRDASITVVSHSDTNRIAKEFASYGFATVEARHPTFEAWLESAEPNGEPI